MIKSDEKTAWKTTVSASMANYIDAGSIVAAGAGLTLWTSYLNLSDMKLGLLAAFSSNAASAAIGALIGGYICDKIGRKFVYAYDLLFYMLGIALIMFSTSFTQLFIGYVITGLSVGADIPASWTLLAEKAPYRERAKHCGSAQIAWSIGPIISLVLAVVLSPLGLLGSRIVFAHLFLVAFLTWILRTNLTESEIWTKQKEIERRAIKSGTAPIKAGFKRFWIKPNIVPLFTVGGFYLFWNLVAGTTGFFMPYIYETIGGVSQALSNVLQILSFAIAAVGAYFIFMRYGDRVSRRKLFALSCAMSVAAWGLLIVAPISLPILLTYILVYGLSTGFGQQPFYQLWASEVFETKYRATAQGIMFAAVRLILAGWSAVFPTLLSQFSFKAAAGFMIAFLVISAVIGIVFAPNTSGKTLEEITDERYGSDTGRQQIN
ncbi:MFS transporter [Sporolactobacillus sp. THM7-7]|nr:MFS transporter [Sporolactobacillus sp. THM7-7]